MVEFSQYPLLQAEHSLAELQLEHPAGQSWQLFELAS